MSYENPTSKKNDTTDLKATIQALHDAVKNLGGKKTDLSQKHRTWTTKNLKKWITTATTGHMDALETATTLVATANGLLTDTKRKLPSAIEKEDQMQHIDK